MKNFGKNLKMIVKIKLTKSLEINKYLLLNMYYSY